jgi:hypothetical protein
MHIATIIEVTVPVLGLLGGMAAYIRSSGQREGRMTAALDENARAIKGLSEVLDRLGTKFDGHEQRITVVETKLDIR